MFKKKFRSLAIVALSFLMVVSFGVGISTFDTKYQKVAHAAQTDDFSISFTNTTVVYTVGGVDQKVETKKSDDGTDVTSNFTTDETFGKGAFSLTNSNDNNQLTSNGLKIKGLQTKFNFVLTREATVTIGYRTGDSGRWISIFDSAGTAKIVIKKSSSGVYTESADLPAGTYYAQRTGNSGDAYLQSISVAYKTAAGGETPADTYTVNYDLKDGTGIDITTQTSESAGITLHDDIPTKTGYTFAGWSLTDDGDIDDADYSSSEVAAGVTLAESNYTDKSVTLYAVWTEKTDFTVTYDANGGSGAPSDSTEYTYNQQVTVSEIEPARTNYEFAGWNTKSDGSGTEYVAGDKFNIKDDVTLYAQWKGLFTVNFYGVDKENPFAVKTISEGGVITLNTANGYRPIRDGYEFAGWFLLPSETTKEEEKLYEEWDFDNDKVTENMNFYAVWRSEISSEQQSTYKNYLENLMENTNVTNSLEQGAWNTETKWRGYYNYVNGVFLNAIVNLSYTEGGNGTVSAKSGENTWDMTYREFVVQYLDRYVSDTENDNGTHTILWYYNGKIYSEGSPLEDRVPDSLKGEEIDSDFKTTNGEPFEQMSRLDFMQTTRMLFDAYEFTGDEKYLKAVEWALGEFADDSAHRVKVGGVELPSQNPSHDYSNTNQIWLDGLYMYGPLYARYLASGGQGKAPTNGDNTGYTFTVANLINQFEYVINNMRNSETGLYHHVYSADGAVSWDDEGGANKSETFWSRGTGWFSMALIDVIDYLNAGVKAGNLTASDIQVSKTFKGESYTTATSYLSAVLRDLMDSVLEYQDDDSKLFYEILNEGPEMITPADPSGSGSRRNYLETSGSAMFAYTLMRGGKQGIFSEDNSVNVEYNKKGREILEGIFAHSMEETTDADGNPAFSVYNIVGATGIDSSKTYGDQAYNYLNTSNIMKDEAKGTSPLALAFIEYFNEDVIQPSTPSIDAIRVNILDKENEENSYGIEFKLGEDEESITYTIDGLKNAFNQKYSELGFVVTNLYSSATSDTPLTSGDTISNDITLYADIEPCYKVKFWAEESENYIGLTHATVYVASGGAVSSGAVANPNKDGYSFSGWYYDSNGNEQQFIIGTTQVTSDLNVYAKWSDGSEIKEFTISFNSNDGSAVGNQTTVNGKLSSLPTPTKEGYTFDGWYQNEDLSGNKVTTDTVFGSNTTLHAKWTVKSYSIEWNLGDGSISSGDKPTSVDFGATVTLPTVIKTGYTFAGWTVTSGGNAVNVVDGKFTMPAGAVTITATWTADTYDVVYNANAPDGTSFTGSLPSNGTATFGESFTIDSTKLSLDGYTFKGWATASNSTEVISTITINAGNVSLISDNKLNLYAVWEEVVEGSKYAETIDFVGIANGKNGNAVTQNDLTGYNYTLGTDLSNVTWDTGDKQYNGIKIKYEGTILTFIVAANRKVEFVSGINSGKSLEYLKDGEVLFSSDEIGSMSTETSDSISLEDITTKETTYTIITKNNTVCALRGINITEIAETYTLTYVYGNGTADKETSVEYNSTVTLESEPSRSGYTFAGWTSSAFSGTKQAGETFTMPAGAVTITANWTEDETPTYTVNYDLNDGSWGNNNQQTANSANISLYQDIPLKTGYNFEGWALSDNATIGQVYYSISNIEEGVTFEESEYTDYVLNLYAVWTENTYTINFWSGLICPTDEIMPDAVEIKYTQLSSYTTLPTLSSSDVTYTFVGWSKESDSQETVSAPFTINDFIDGELTLYSVWEEVGDTPTQTTSVELFKAGVWINGETIPNVNSSKDGITYQSVGLNDIVDRAIATIDGETFSAGSANVLRTGSNTSATRYIKFTISSEVYSQFNIKIVAAGNGDGNRSIWVSSVGPSNALADGEEFLLTATSATAYLTGTASGLATSNGTKDITYYINTNNNIRIYEISLELTKDINTDIERTISFVTDDNDTRPFDGAIADRKVQNGDSLDLADIVPTTSSQGYVFSHWVDSLGNVYTTSIDNVLRDMTLYAKWYTVVDSADTPESTRGKVPLADAQVYGLYLPSTTTIRLANGSTASWTVDWNWENVSYRESESDDWTTGVNISNYANIDVAGFYKVTGTITVPSGYLYKIEEIETSTITVESIVEVYVIGAQVMAGAGYMADGRTAWNSGLTLTNDRYTLSENGQVSIVVDADNIGEITSDGVINLKGETFSNSTYQDNAPIEINLPSEYSMLLIVIKVTNATSNNVSLWTSDGKEISLGKTVGATYTNLSISTTEAYGNVLYLFTSGNTQLHTIVVNAQYADAEVDIQTQTHKLSYYTVVNDDMSFSGQIEEAYKYLDQAKVIVKPQTLQLPEHYLFSKWATATSGTASYYNPGDVLTVTSETNNLYPIMDEEPKITITFDVNAPAGMTEEDIIEIFGSATMEFKIYSGESLAEYWTQITAIQEKTPEVGGYTYQFDGWSLSITQDTTFNEDTTVTANWYTDTLPVIVKDLEKTVQEGTTDAEIINSLPTEFVVCDINGNETSDYDDAYITGSWSAVNGYNSSVTGSYLFKATLNTAPSGTLWYPNWSGVEFDSQTYDRSQNGTYYVYCKVEVVEADAYATYSAEFTAFAYTGSGDHVLYNNNSNTHDKAWSDYYQVATDEETIPGTIVARNGEVKVIADNETKVGTEDGKDVTAALVDTDYHGQTWSMIKGYHKTSNNAPFIYVVVPKGYTSVKISVYAVRFRASGNDVTLEVGPLNGTKENMLVTDHSYTETDNETDFNYFYEFSPSYYLYEYSGDGNDTVFTVRNTHNSTNIYLTGIKVEYTMVETESHIITYHANDGTDNALTREVVYAENKNGDDAIVEKNFFEREGYEFIGWSRTKGAEVIESNYQVGKSLELDGNITLYAVWQRARALTYYANDDSGDSFTKYYVNGRGPLSENEFDMTAEIREDKVFLSWNTKSDGSGTTYYPGDIFNPNGYKNHENPPEKPTASDIDNRLVGVIPEGTVLYAQWGSGKTLTAKWDAYSSELQAIDTVYTDCSQTLGNDWTTKYNGKIIAKNGDVLTVNASGATAGSNAMSKPMLSLAKGNTISVNVSGITTESALSIRVSAVVASGSSKFTINGTEYSVSRTFDDGSTFTPFVADIAVYATTVNNTSTINITTTGNNTIYIVGISASVSNDQFVGKTLTYNNNVEGAEETYDYLVSDSTIVDINRFHRDGYTFAGWNTSADGEGTAYSYGATLEVSNDTTLYAKWTPKTYNYKFINGEDTYASGTFEFGSSIAKPGADPELNGYIFMGWYLDDGVFQNQADFTDGFAPSFEMIDGDTVYFYAYFVENINTKKIVTPNVLQNLEKYIVDVMENVYREEGSTSGTAVVSASALGLPATVMVTGEGFGKSLAIDWSLAVHGWTLSSLQSGIQTLTGYVRLDDSDYEDFAFSDGEGDDVNKNLQQIGVTVDLTLRNIIIQFTENEPLVEKNFVYPIGTTKSAVISAFEVKGYYLDRSGVSKEWIPEGLVWTCDSFNKDVGGEYIFRTTLYADIGYAFNITDDEGQTVESNTKQAEANVKIQDSKNAYAGVGFERKDSSDWTQGIVGDLTIDSNGDVGNQLVLTGLSNSYGNENGYLTLDAGENALKVSFPKGVQSIVVKFVGGVRTANNSSTLSVVDGSGNSLATPTALGVYTSAEIETLSIETNGLTEFFIKSVGDEIILSKLLINAHPVNTTSDNIVKVKFVYADGEKYLTVSGGGDYENATSFVKSAKIELPTFAETGLDNAPTAQNIEFIGWSTDESAQVASYQAGGLYDIDLYSDQIINGNEEKITTLYAVFNVGYYTLTFDSGYGNTAEYKIPKNKQVFEVITIRGVGREQALKDLELSRVGYNFVDWYYNGEIFSSSSELYDDIVVTATWTPKTYTINYKNGNEIITTDMVTYSEMFSAPVLDKNPDYINTTRTFRTWTYNGADWNFGQASLESSGIITDNDIYEIDLQADFGAKVTFKTEYAEVVGSAYPVVQDSNVYPIGYRYALTDKFTNLMGYTFVGWSLTQNSPTAEFTTESVIELTENITLFAVWRANEYKITFESGNANIDFATLEVEGKTLENNSGMFTFNTELPTITATANGYVIHSWYYIDSQGFERTWVFGGDNPNRVIASENKDGEMVPFTLYARWGITVNFEKFSVIANDDEFNQNADLYDSVIVPVGDAIPFVHTQGTASLGSALHVRPQIPGYSFVGWYTDNEGAQEFDINQAFTIDFINSLKANSTDTAVTIYAGFEKVTGNVVITFVDAFDTGVSMPQSIQHANSAFFIVTSEYMPEGNSVAQFVGWSLYPDGSGEIYGLDGEVFIEGDTVLYAFWSISITDIEILSPTVRNDETIQVQIPSKFNGSNGEQKFDEVFNVIWMLDSARNAEDPSDETIYNLIAGAYNVKAGSYSVPVQLRLEKGYVWAGGEDIVLSANGDYYTTNVKITVTDSAQSYFIIEIYSIEDKTPLNSDYRLDKVKAEISTISTATSGIEIMLDVTWNSQIDTTVWGTHYVLGSVLCGSYKLKTDVSNTVSATIEVTKNGEENAYLYKTYQNGKMPDAPDAPSEDFKFLCWTDKGVTAVGQNQAASAGEWTAMYTKLSFTEGASIRLNKDYTGIRFTAHLEFYGTNYVAELMKNKSNVSGAVSVTMNFTYEKGETTYNVGTGQDFMNMTQSVEGGNAIITFSGVISDLVVYDSEGNVTNKENCGIKFTPIAKVKLNGLEVDNLRAEFAMSASEVAQGVKKDSAKYSSYTDEQKAIIDSYDTTVS